MLLKAYTKWIQLAYDKKKEEFPARNIPFTFQTAYQFENEGQWEVLVPGIAFIVVEKGRGNEIFGTSSLMDSDGSTLVLVPGIAFIDEWSADDWRVIEWVVVIWIPYF